MSIKRASQLRGRPIDPTVVPPDLPGAPLVRVCPAPEVVLAFGAAAVHTNLPNPVARYVLIWQPCQFSLGSLYTAGYPAGGIHKGVPKNTGRFKSPI